MATSDLRSVTAQLPAWLVEEVDRICDVTRQSRTSFILTSLLGEVSRLTAHRRVVAPLPAAGVAAVNDSKPLTETQLRYFKAFWDAYPRKQGKGTAKKAYRKALGLIGGPIEKAAIRILKGANRWNQHVHDTNKEEEYVKLPATWLNSEGWEDILPTDKWIGSSPLATGPSQRSKVEAAERAKANAASLEEKLREDGSLSQSDEAALIRFQRVISEGNMSVSGDNMHKPATRRPQ